MEAGKFWVQAIYVYRLIYVDICQQGWKYIEIVY